MDSRWNDREHDHWIERPEVCSRRHVEYLCVCVRGLFVVVSWSQNVHLLDAHVHVPFIQYSSVFNT